MFLIRIFQNVLPVLKDFMPPFARTGTKDWRRHCIRTSRLVNETYVCSGGGARLGLQPWSGPPQLPAEFLITNSPGPPEPSNSPTPLAVGQELRCAHSSTPHKQSDLETLNEGASYNLWMFTLKSSTRCTSASTSTLNTGTRKL